MICAGLDEGGRDTCDGDSGGPLVIYDEDKNHVLVGVASWGDDICGAAHSPGVYAKVSSVLDWIKKEAKMET